MIVHSTRRMKSPIPLYLVTEMPFAEMKIKQKVCIFKSLIPHACDAVNETTGQHINLPKVSHTQFAENDFLVCVQIEGFSCPT